MRIRLLFAAALAALLVPASAALVDAPAQKNKPPSEEARLIRTLIAKLDAGERVRNSPDSIFASGSTPRPLVGTREQQRFSRGAGKELQRSGPNAKTQTNVRRLVVASSGDLAYEFSGSSPSGTRRAARPASTARFFASGARSTASGRRKRSSCAPTGDEVPKPRHCHCFVDLRRPTRLLA